MDFFEASNCFMIDVKQTVWTQLNDRGIDYTFGEMLDHFKNMMVNPDIQNQIVNIFLKQFDCEIDGGTK